MSSIIDVILELFTIKDIVRKEIQKPLNEEILDIIYDINPSKKEANIDEILKSYNAKDMLELVNKIKDSMVKK
ncbi:hypothetical protein CM19_12790 [Candidatus Acidianus copahuensis]|uniref:Uncharacterized protein n=1 Tax=Candidatus Acidianus copahuensis TaxID=1160895 RepID=A0A031LHG8_9CREN|nr:hypothetical protein [Candidatus Acidianus copahuensis]EZQ01602.1 hypothetical protein CM19_12790 [Candidatus Acidianus copahuensis]